MAPGAAHLRGARHRHGRAAVREPDRPEPELRGQRRPDAGHLHVDDDGGHDAARHRDPAPAARDDRVANPPRSGDPTIPSRSTFFRHRQRDAGARADVRVLARRRAVAVARASSPRVAVEGLLPGLHTFRVRAIDLAGNVDPTPATAPGRSSRRRSRRSGGRRSCSTPPACSSARARARSSSSRPTSRARPSSARSTRAADSATSAVPCTSPSAFCDGRERRAQVRGPRDQPGGRGRGAAGALRVVVELGPTRRRRTRDPHRAARGRRERGRAPSSSPAATTAPATSPSSARSTARRTTPAPRPSSAPTSRAARTCCSSARATPPATSTRRRRATSGSVEAPPLTTILSGARARRDHREHERDVHLRRRRARLDLLVLARRRARRELQLAEDVHRTWPVGEHSSPSSPAIPNGIWEEQWAEYEWRDRPREPRRSRSSTPAPDVESESSRRGEFAFHSRTSEDVTFVCSLDGGDPLPVHVAVRRPAASPPGEHEFEVDAVHPTDPRPRRRAARAALRAGRRRSTSGRSSTRRRPTRRSCTARRADDRARAPTSASPRTRRGATIECSLDFEGFGGCETPTVFEDLLDGEHVLQVRAVDEAENADPTPGDVPLDGRARPRRTRRSGSNVDGRAADRRQRRARRRSTSSRSASPARPRSSELGGGPPVDLPGYGGGRFFDIAHDGRVRRADHALPPVRPGRLRRRPRPHPRATTAASGPTSRSPTTRRRRRSAPSPRTSASSRSRAAPTMDADRDDHLRAGSSQRERHRDVHVRGGRARRDDAVLDRRPAVHAVRVADHVHAPRDRRPQVRGPGDRARSAASTQLLPTLYEWEVALPLDTTPPDTQIVKGPPALTGNQIVAARVHRHRRPDDRHRPRVRVPARRRPPRLLLVRSSSHAAACPACPYEVEVEEGAYGKHTVADPRDRRDGQRRPDAGEAHVDVRRRQRARHLDRARARGGDRGHDRHLRVHRRGPITGQHAVRLRVLARRRRLPALHLAAHGRGPDGRPARLPGARGQPVRRRRLDAGALRVADHPAARPRPAGHVHRRTPPAHLRSGRDLRLPEQRARRGVRVLARRRAVRRLRRRARARGPRRPASTRSRCARSTIGQNVDPTPAAYTWTVVGEPDTIITSGPPEISGQRERDVHLRLRPAERDLPVLGRRLAARRRAPRRSSPARWRRTGTTFEVYAVNQFRYLDGERGPGPDAGRVRVGGPGRRRRRTRRSCRSSGSARPT